MKFTGKEREAETGLDYFRARHMAPGLGRFLQPDPPFADQDPSDPQSWHLSGYARNNPLSYIDPTGRDVTCSGDGEHFRCVDNVPPPPPFDCFFYRFFCEGGGGGTGPITTPDPPPPPAQTQNPNAPNNQPTVSHCLAAAAKEKGLSIALDIVGAIPVFGNATSATAGVVRAAIAVDHVVTKPAVALTSGAYGAYGAVSAGTENPADSLFGAGSAGVGIGLTLADLSLQGTKAIPLVGNAVSVLTLGWDAYQAIKKYQACMGKPD